MNTINFYYQNNPYGYFSNFSKHPIKLKGKIWPTSEHYFQAQKFIGTKYEEDIRLCKSAGECAQMGRDKKLPLRRDWEIVKDNIMMEVLIAKFSQHPDLKKYLLDTGSSILVEHTSNDMYWGDGGDGSGKNMLGKLLMIARDTFRGQQK